MIPNRYYRNYFYFQSGTLAFGWALSQNFHRMRRRKTAEDFFRYYQIEPYGIPRKSLCPHRIVKAVLLQNVLAQPNDLIEVKSLVAPEKVRISTAELPVFGPKTAEEVSHRSAGFFYHILQIKQKILNSGIFNVEEITLNRSSQNDSP